MTQKIIIEQGGKTITAACGDKVVKIESPSEEDCDFKTGAEKAFFLLIDLMKTSEDRAKEFVDAMFNDNAQWYNERRC